MKILVTVLLTLLATAAVGFGLIHGGGLTNFAADEAHPALVDDTIAFFRERSIAARSKGIAVPDLDDPKRIASGAAHYRSMCMGCHLAPGVEDTELRRGLYPQPPDLSRPDVRAGGPARQFWIVKHGIKMTGMPAWGTSHDDTAIWDLVAFVQKLPDLSPEAFAALSHDHSTHSH